MRIFCIYICILGTILHAESYGPSFQQPLPSTFTFSNTTGGTLDCGVSGEPPPTVTWSIQEGTPLGQHPGLVSTLSNGSLQFHPFSPERWRSDLHDTLIRCEASNVYGSVLSTVVHVKGVIEETLVIKVIGEPVLKLNTGILKCQIPNSMKHQVQIVSWKFGNNFVYPTKTWPKDLDLIMVPSGELHITAVDYQHTHHPYFCIVKHRNSGTSQESLPFHLTVRDPMSYSKPEQMTDQEFYISVEQGKTAALPCRVQSAPPPTLSWFHVNSNLLQPVSYGNRIHSLAHMLLVEDTQASDGGQYRCTARNEMGELSVTLHLQVEPPLVVDLVPAEQVIDIGRGAHMQCLTEERDRSTILWRKDGLVLASSNRINLNQQTLQIYNLQREDYGVYQCFVTRGNREVEATAQLRLGDAAPYLVYEFIEQTLQPGPPVCLKCSCKGSPTPQISWTKNGFGLPTSDRYMMGQYVTVHGEVISHVNISRTVGEDGGLYSCTATNRAGTASHSARLNVYGPPLVHPIPEIKAVVGKTLQIICPASGYPLDKIAWTRADRKLSSGDRLKVFSNGTLVISSVQNGDDGSYTCTATNRRGLSSSSTATIRVIVPPKLQNPGYSQKTLQVDQRFSLFCSIIAGDEPISLYWQKDGNLLVESDSDGVTISKVEHDSILRFSNLEAHHMGNYSCHASNEAGSAVKFSYIQVKADYIEGQGLRQTCFVSEGDPPMLVSWFRDGHKVESSETTRITRIDEVTSLLAISDLSSRHAGNYSCVAKNEVAVVSVTASLVVRVPARWRTKPVDESAVEGQSVSFHCQVGGVPAPTVTWTIKSGRQKSTYTVTGQGGQTEDLQIMGNGTLVIWRVALSDQGEYTCAASNDVGDSISKTVNLKINAPPRFMMEGDGVMSAHQGKDVHLECRANGDDPISIMWRREGKELIAEPGRSSITVIREIQHVTSKFSIYKTQKGDSGRYECQASNPFGKSFYHIHLQIWEPPNSPDNLTMLSVTSRTARLSWSISRAEPKIERFVVQWKSQHDSWELQAEEKTLYGQVEEAILSSLRPAIVYQVRVFAENELGRSKEGRVLQFITDGERPEGAPNNIRVSAVSSSQLDVMWDQPNSEVCHGNIIRYNIGYKEFGLKTPFHFFDLDRFEWDKTRFHFLLRRLKKFSKYEVVVQAVNIHGEGPLSDIMVGHTKESAPEAAPQQVECLPLSSSGLHLKWRAPPHDLVNGQIKGYRVLFVPFPDRLQPAQSKLNTARLSAVIGTTTALTGLRANTNYSVQVLAYTSAGDGVLSQPLSCSTESDVPGPPASIKVVVDSQDAVVVAWLPPHSPNGAIVHYNVYVREVEYGREKSHASHQVSGAVTSYRVTGLRPGTQHQFWVTANTRRGEGQSSQVVSKTPSGRHGAQITDIGREVFLSWRSQVLLSCSHSGSTSPLTRWFFQGVEATWVNQASLYGRSQLKIDSAVSEDSGNYTCVIENTQVIDSISYSLRIQVPPKPPAIRVHRVTSDSITLRWTNTDIGNSPIISYRIKYKITYGDWTEKLVSFYSEEFTLTNLYCGRQYHMVMYQANYIGESDASQIINTNTVGDKPLAPPQSSFIIVNSSLAILRLDKWQQLSCPILYFVIEYKLRSENPWTIVTNNLQLQDVYSIRGLSQGTSYDLKAGGGNITVTRPHSCIFQVTAHNHAGSSSQLYHFTTLNSLGQPAQPRGGLAGVLQGLGFRASLSIVVSVLCLVLASLGVCFCIRKKQVSKRPGRYDEMPKSATMENRHNLLEQQFYATVQRKTPALTPFSSGYEVDTIEQLKRAVRSQVEKIPETAADISPYATSEVQNMPALGRNTIGRKETMRMTDYNKHKLSHPDTGTSRPRDTETGGWRSAKMGKRPRRRYSESEEYDSDTDSERQDCIFWSPH